MSMYNSIFISKNAGFTGGALLQKHTTLSSFLSVPDLREKEPFKPKTSARVLTSTENLHAIAAKEKEKEEKEALKKERFKRKEEKRQLKC